MFLIYVKKKRVYIKIFCDSKCDLCDFCDQFDLISLKC